MILTSPTVDRTQAAARGGMRVLVVIASFGEKNLGFLNTIIQQYHGMTMAVDVVVVSEAPKQLAAHVTVAVGLPAKNPWSLPFAHKEIFSRNADRYDLFIYSEDDIDVTEGHISAFLDATSVLKADEIAGFLRYEKDAAGTVWMPDAHGMFHWKPESVARRDGRTFAEYTNEHAAFYILTQAQLRRSIASGGFLRSPHEGRYDMLCAAATDPYTSCGLRKMVCVSDLQPFLVHHMSNRYAGRMGLPLSSFTQQLDTLALIGHGSHPKTTLCEVETKLPLGEWGKSFYEPPSEAVLAMIPASATTVLSVGCGWGGTEARLLQRGAQVTALPLNSVIGAVAARVGVKPIYGRLEDCLIGLGGKKFDCVLISNLLHLQVDPEDLFKRCAALVGEGGTVVVDSPNFDRMPIYAKRMLGLGHYKKLRAFSEGGINVFSLGTLGRWARTAGFSGASARWYNHSLPSTANLNRLRLELGRVTAANWVFRSTLGRSRPRA